MFHQNWKTNSVYLHCIMLILQYKVSLLLIDLVVALILFIFMLALLSVLCLQCFDAVGWAAGRASGL